MWLTSKQLLELIQEACPDDGKLHSLYITEYRCYVDGKCVARQSGEFAAFLPGTVSDVQLLAEVDYDLEAEEEEVRNEIQVDEETA